MPYVKSRWKAQRSRGRPIFSSILRHFVAVFQQQLRLSRISLTLDSQPPDHPFGPVTCLIV